MNQINAPRPKLHATLALFFDQILSITSYFIVHHLVSCRLREAKSMKQLDVLRNESLGTCENFPDLRGNLPVISELKKELEMLHLGSSTQLCLIFKAINAGFQTVGQHQVLKAVGK